MDSPAESYAIPTQQASDAGVHVPMELTSELTDRLEVPEEWQWWTSFDGRVGTVLDALKEETARAPAGSNPIRFAAIIQSNVTGRSDTLDLLASYDGEIMTIGFFDETL